MCDFTDYSVLNFLFFYFTMLEKKRVYERIRRGSTVRQSSLENLSAAGFPTAQKVLENNVSIWYFLNRANILCVESGALG